MEGQDVVALDEAGAAAEIAKLNLFDAPTEPKKKLPPKDPATGKFTKPAEPVEVTEDVAEDAEPTEEPVEAEAEETEEEAPPVPTVKVKLDGIEQELPIEEVTKGYLRQADYTKKTQELAAQRRQLEEQELPAVRQERQAYSERLQALTEALEALAPSQEPDWAQYSKVMTPEEFTRHFQEWKANRDRVEKVKQEHARVRDLQQQDEDRAMEARLRQEREKLEQALPELKDPEKGKVLREDLTAYAKSIGFTDDDLGDIVDHRALVILDKARRWDESQKRRPTVAAKVEKAIESLKPSGAKPTPRAKVAEQAKSRLMQERSVDAAAEALRALNVFG